MSCADAGAAVGDVTGVDAGGDTDGDGDAETAANSVVAVESVTSKTAITCPRSATSLLEKRRRILWRVLAREESNHGVVVVGVAELRGVVRVGVVEADRHAVVVGMIAVVEPQACWLSRCRCSRTRAPGGFARGPAGWRECTQTTPSGHGCPASIVARMKGIDPSMVRRDVPCTKNSSPVGRFIHS